MRGDAGGNHKRFHSMTVAWTSRACLPPVMEGGTLRLFLGKQDKHATVYQWFRLRPLWFLGLRLFWNSGAGASRSCFPTLPLTCAGCGLRNAYIYYTAYFLLLSCTVLLSSLSGARPITVDGDFVCWTPSLLVLFLLFLFLLILLYLLTRGVEER